MIKYVLFLQTLNPQHSLGTRTIPDFHLDKILADQKYVLTMVNTLFNSQHHKYGKQKTVTLSDQTPLLRLKPNTGKNCL